MSRKPIPKRVRFEIFKRDAFTCQYCGSHPPDAVLEIDHVIAVANGGDNDPDNLITACFGCNRGKGAVPLDAVPQSLTQKAAVIAEREEQLRGYNAILDARRERVENDVWRVVEYMTGETRIAHDKFDSIKRFAETLGVHEVLDAVDIAKAKRPRADYAQWKYFCGVCWGKIRNAGL